MSNRALLEEMKAQRKETIERITKSIKDTQTQRRQISAELKKKGSSTIRELEQATGISARDILHHLIAMRKAGEVTEVDLREEGYVYALRRAK